MGGWEGERVVQSIWTMHYAVARWFIRAVGGAAPRARLDNYVAPRFEKGFQFAERLVFNLAHAFLADAQSPAQFL